MLEPTLRLLAPRPGGRYVDLTTGAGGHARAILERSAPDGHLLAIDRDAEALAVAEHELAPYADRLQLVHGAFSQLDVHLRRVGWSRVDGLLADLGVSSMQLDRGRRGFSFERSGPLDMRMDASRGRPLAALLDQLEVDHLAAALRRLGEVPRPRPLARRIMEAHRGGELTDTTALARLVGGRRRPGKIHPATKVFMALRLLVNDELGELERLLAQLPEPLAPGGRAVFIAFHSLEDRAVKRRFAELERGCICPPDLPVCGCGRRPALRLLTRGALRPDEQECAHNRRARSARLRAAERLAA